MQNSLPLFSSTATQTNISAKLIVREREKYYSSDRSNQDFCVYVVMDHDDEEEGLFLGHEIYITSPCLGVLVLVFICALIFHLYLFSKY